MLGCETISQIEVSLCVCVNNLYLHSSVLVQFLLCLQNFGEWKFPYSQGYFSMEQPVGV